MFVVPVCIICNTMLLTSENCFAYIVGTALFQKQEESDRMHAPVKTINIPSRMFLHLFLKNT